MQARAPALALIALLVAVGTARAAPGPSEPEVLLRRELARHLKPSQIDRLLGEPRVEKVLAEMFQGWDGVADEVHVEEAGGGLVVRTLIKERRCLAQLAMGPEATSLEPVCDDAVRAGGDRRVTLEPDLWKPKAPRVASVRPAPEPPPAAPEPTGPVDNTVLRRAPGIALEDEVIAAARAEHEQLRARLARPHWKDPLLPDDPVLAGEAIRPFDPIEPAAEASVEGHLRNPFDEARMRPQDPVPEMLWLMRDGGTEPLLPAPREECSAQWRLGLDTPEAPTLDCYRRVAWNDRLEADPAYQVLSRVASVLRLPVLESIVALQVKGAVSHRAHRAVWALVWVAWLERHPERMADALLALTPEERRFVRRRLAEWWVEDKLAELRPTITRLFERNLLGLYPEATDLDGLPRRAYVADTWLWANNWLAILDGRPAEAIETAYQRLSPPERKVIHAFVHDRDLSRRWAHAAEVIASL